MKRLFVVVVIAVAGFAAALVAFGDAARRGCATDAPRDPAYEAALEEPVHVGEPTHILTLTHHGEPVTGAWVCVTVEMAGMTAMAASAEAREVSGGRYEVDLPFAMAGEWQATVLVGEEEAIPHVAVPLSFDVMGGD